MKELGNPQQKNQNQQKTIMTTMTKKVLDKARKAASKATENAAKAVNDFKTVPGYSNYELNSKNVLRSKKTGNVQQIPTGKKKYLIYNDKGERKSIGIDEIVKLVGAFKPVKEKAQKKSKPIFSSEIIAEIKSRSDVKEICETQTKKHVKCIMLKHANIETEVISEILNIPLPSVLRNIWLYSTGRKKLC